MNKKEEVAFRELEASKVGGRAGESDVKEDNNGGCHVCSALRYQEGDAAGTGGNSC